MTIRRNRAVNRIHSPAAARRTPLGSLDLDPGRDHDGLQRLGRARAAGQAPALRRALVGSTALTGAAVCGYVFLSDAALALPTDGSVVEGQAEIVYGDNSITINQGSDRVIIQWQTFDIAANESVNFIQPSEFAAALNRVLSGAPSQILGSLTANGQIVISNPAGVVFGPGANVDVQSIVATSLNIMNQDFMNSRLAFQLSGEGAGGLDADPRAMVENRGTIEASGLAALVGPGARNSGLIVANVTVLAGGEAVAFDPYGDGLVSYAVTAPTTMRPVDADGNLVDAVVSNSGTILADGGQVVLTADAMAGIVDNVINLDGVIQANTIETHGGQVALVAGDAGTVRVAGTIAAIGDGEGEGGGTVHVLGETVVLADGARIDVSGQAGGGTALIGGDQGGGAHVPTGSLAYLAPSAGGRSGTTIVVDSAFQSAGFIPAADVVYVDGGAGVAANAADAGNGGTIIAWANDEMQFYGTFSAQGGPNGGNGGFIEVSSGGTGVVDGTLLVGAVSGLAGQALLDPRNVCVGNSTGSCGLGSGAFLVTTGTIETFFLNNAGGLFTVTTNLSGSDAGDIEIGSDLEIEATGTGSRLEFLARDDIRLDSGDPITVTGAALDIFMHAGAYSGASGTQEIFIDDDISTNGGTFTAIAESFVLNSSGDTIDTTGSAGDVFITADAIDLGGSIVAGTATVFIERLTDGRISLGDDNGGLHISQAELENIDAGALTVGGGQTTDIDVDNVGTTTGTITGLVTLLALDPAGPGSESDRDIRFNGDNTFAALTATARDDIRVQGGSVTTEGGDINFTAGENNTQDADVVIVGDIFTQGGNFTATADDDIVFDSDGGAAGDLFTAGGDVWLETLGVGDGSIFQMVGGTNIETFASGPEGNVTIIADDVILDTGSGIRIDTADGGPTDGTITFRRATDGVIALGSAAGGAGILHLSQGELDELQAQRLVFGAADELVSHTTIINVGGVDLDGFEFVDMFAFGGASINYTGANVFVNLTATDGTDINVLAGGSVTADTIFFDAPEVNLGGQLVATGGPGGNISGTATTVNVSPGGEIQDGVDVASDAGVLASDVVVNVADGNYTATDGDGVDVYKTLSLIGNVGGATTAGADLLAPYIDRTPAGSAGRPGSVGFYVTGDNVVIAGFILEDFETGILADRGSGEHVDGTSVDFNNNSFIDNSTAIYVDEYADVSVTYNDIDQARDNGVIIEDFSASTADVSYNEIDGIGNGVGVLIWDTFDNEEMTATVSHNVITDFADGIAVDRRFEDDPAQSRFESITISHNDISRIGDDAIDFRLDLVDTSVDINHNDAEGGDNAVEFAGVSGESSVSITDNNSGFVGLDADGIAFEGAISGPDVDIDILRNIIAANDHGIAFDMTVSGGANIDIHDNTITANTDGGVVGAGIYFGGDVLDALVNIGDGNGADEGAGFSNVISVGGTPGASASELDAIHFHSTVGGTTVIVIDGNRLGYTADPVAAAVLPDDGIEFEGPVTGTASVDITDNWIRAADDGVQFSSQVGSAPNILIGGEYDGNHIYAGDDGVSFLAALTGESLVEISYNWIEAGSDGVLFQGPVDNAVQPPAGPNEQELLIAHNDIFGGTNGIHFASTISGDRHDTRIVYNTHINGAAGDGIQIEGLITDADVRIENNNHGIYGGANGVHLLAGLDGTAFLRIHGNVIRAEDADGVLIDGVGVSDYAELEITENRIGMTSGGGVERVGDEGVDIETITDHGSVLIGWNRIFAEGTGIQVDGPVTTVSQNLSFGYSPGQFGIAIIENHNIDALYGHGIQFADEVNGPPGQTVNILIAENNDGIHAGQHGITFDDYVDNANIHIHGNIIDAGLDDHVSDGVHFGGIVEDSWIKIDDHDDGPRHLNAYGDGIDFDALVVDSTIIIDDNDINAGGEPGERGIEFSAGVDDSVVEITRNNIHSGDDGVLFNGVGIAGHSRVWIGHNNIGSFGDPVGQTPDEDGAGIDIQQVVDSAAVKIYENDIIAQDIGIQFDDDITTTSGFFGGFGVAIVDNDHIVGLDDDGVQFLGGILGSDVLIDGNNHGIFGGDDGIQVYGDVTGYADVVISNNRIEAHDNGVSFRGAITDHAEILITDNAGWYGGVQRGIFAGGNGIVFGGPVDHHASIVIGGWDGYYPDGNTIYAYEHGVVFEDVVTDWASVEISYNLIKAGYAWWSHSYRSSDYDGVRFEGETDNVGHGDRDIAIVGNDITGSGNGIHFLQELDGRHHDVLIGWNEWIEGLHRDGINMGDGVDEASLRIVHNDWIEGRRDGIDFDGLVQDGAFVLIGDNWKILGRHDSGIEFSGVVDWNTDVVIDHNKLIVGGDNGIWFQQPELLALTSFGGGWGGWSIDQAEVTISNNWLIKGEDENGIWVEGVRGSGYGFHWDNPNLAIVHNHKIWGHDNGILISRVIEGGLTWDPEFGPGFEISGWAVENAEVLIGWNHEIEGHKDDGIQIQGIHATSGFDSCGCSDTFTASFGGGGDWPPSAEVDIVGNWEIEGHDNGINLARGFDLAIYGAGPGSFGALDLSSLSTGGLPGLETLGGDWTVTFSAWAIENADVTIAWNGEIEGERDDGIFVGGIRSTSDGGAAGKSLGLESFGGWGGWGPSASLTIEHNWEIEGHDNGIKLGRGVDFTLYDLDFGYSGPTPVSLADVDVEDAGGLLGWLPEEASIDFEAHAWAIENAQVSIAWNHEIEGERDDGIFVGGIHTVDGFAMGTGALTLGGFGGGWGGHGASLTIDHNWEIEGHDNGINLGRGLDLSVDVDYDVSPGDYDLDADLALDAWAIDGATVAITDNGRISGERDDGIRVGGVRDGGGSAISAISALGGGWGGWGHDPNLLIADNWKIEGHDNGINLERGLTVSAYAYLYEGSGSEAETYFSVYGSLYLSAYAIDNATVRILDNHLIEGERDDGIHVGGVRDDSGVRQRSLETAYDGFYGDYDRTELKINGNHLILGHDNGVALDHGYALSVYADVSYEDYGSGCLAELCEVSALTEGFGEGGFDLAGFDIGDGEPEVNYVSISGSAVAIHGAEVEIGDNGAIIGEHRNGILVNGVVDVSPPEREPTEPDLALVGGGSETWNLNIHDNGLIIGKKNGILIDHAYSGYLAINNGYYIDYPAVSAGFQAWGIYDGNVRIGNNWLIAGLTGDGIQVNGVHGPGVAAASAFFDDDEESETFDSIVPVETDPAQPQLLIEQNTTIVGHRDGIHFGTGFGFDFSYDGYEEGSIDSLASVGEIGSLGFGHGHEHGASVEGGLVVIDLNGVAEYQAEPEDGGAAIGDPYDPEIAVVLSDLDFGFGLFDLGGRVAGVTGDGIDFAGRIHEGSTVQIQRNMLTGSGDNGIEFAGIGEALVPEIFSIGPALIDEEEERYGPTHVFIHNNFIVDNGRSLVEEEPEEPDEGPTEPTLVDTSFPGSGMTVGAGILFEQGIGDVFGNTGDPEFDETGGVEVFQNFIAGNGGPGIQIGFPEEEAPEEELLSLSGFGYGHGYWGDDNYRHFDGVVSADNLLVIHNYLPGSVDEFDDRPNGSFAVANYANDGSTVTAPENWWGTAASAAAVAAQSFGSVSTTPYLATGEDSNEERIPGFTGLGPFAFQPGPTVGPSIEDLFGGFPVDPDLIRFIPRGPLSSLDRPGGAQYFTNELGEPYQTNVFGPGYGIGELSGPGGLQPAAGGQQGDEGVCAEGDEECQQEQGQQPQGQQGPVNLGGLTPAAGPGSQQANTEDTCVATFLGDFWNAAAACQ